MSVALTATTGKIGGAVLNSVLEHNLLPPSSLIICTSSDPEDARWQDLKSKGAQIRKSNYDDPESMIRAFSGCTKIFLVSTPKIELDYGDAPPGHGRERQHFNAINAARAAGVQHIYYTSLAFGSQSKTGVMQAHLRTEAYLARLKDMKVTVIREGLYNESWPLYLGFYFGLKNDERDEVVVAGDGPVSWTSIADLGLGTALVLADPSTKYDGKTIYLSQTRTATLKDVAKIVSDVKGREIALKIVSSDEFCRHYVENGREKGNAEWWCTTYDALTNNECSVQDPTLEELLASKGRKPKQIEETIREMLS